MTNQCMLCHEAGVEKRERKTVSLITLLAVTAVFGLLALILGSCSLSLYWAMLGAQPRNLFIALVDPILFLLISGLTVVCIAVVASVFFCFARNSIGTRYLYHYLNDGKYHSHLEKPDIIRWILRQKLSGWFGTSCVMENEESQSYHWSLNIHGEVFVLKDKLTGNIVGVQKPIVLLSLLSLRHDLEDALLQLLERDRAREILLDNLKAISDVIRDPGAARSPYGKFLAEALEIAIAHATTSLTDVEPYLNFLKVLSTKYLPKRKTAVQPAS